MACFEAKAEWKETRELDMWRSHSFMSRAQEFPHTRTLASIILSQMHWDHFFPTLCHFASDRSLCEEFSYTSSVCCYFFLLFPLSHFTEIPVLLMLHQIYVSLHLSDTLWNRNTSTLDLND